MKINKMFKSLIFVVILLCCASILKAAVDSKKLVSFGCICAFGSRPTDIIDHDNGAISHIYMLHNDIDILCKISPDVVYDHILCHYKINADGEWTIGVLEISRYFPPNLIYTILGSELDQKLILNSEYKGYVYYYLEAMNEGTSLATKPLGVTTFNRDNSTMIYSIELTNRISGLNPKLTLPDGNVHDGETFIEVPEGGASPDIIYTILQNEPKNLPRARVNKHHYMSAEPIAGYTFMPFGQKFKYPATISLLYPRDKQIIKQGRFTAQSVTQYTAQDLQVFYWNGFEWLYYGGKNNQDLSTLTIQVDSLFNGIYGFAIFYTDITKELFKTDRKFITPACADGINDYVRFTGLDGLSQNTSVKIFDITGNPIRNITSRPYVWDGRDNRGRIVESGVYVYQFRVKINNVRTLVSGTIIVAK